MTASKDLFNKAVKTTKSIKIFLSACLIFVFSLFISSLGFTTNISNFADLNTNYLNGRYGTFNILADITFEAALSNTPLRYSSPWNAFVEKYQTSYINIAVDEDLSPIPSDDNIDLRTSTTAIRIFVDEASSRTIDAQRIKTGFISQGSTITFENLAFKNFLNMTSSGGVINMNSRSSITYLGYIEFSSNIASHAIYGNGGAIYASESNISFSNSSVSFINNSAYTNGGALYLTNSAFVTFYAVNYNVLFIGNKANGKNNDIHINDVNSTLVFNVGADRTITMNGGITGNGTINKQGTGDLIFKDGAIIDYQGKFDINAGKVKFEAANIQIATLTVNAGANLIFTGDINHSLYTSSITINGFLEIGVDLTNWNIDTIFSTNSIYINPQISSLSVVFYNLKYAKGTLPIFNLADNGSIYFEKFNEVTYSEEGDFEIKKEGQLINLIIKDIILPISLQSSKNNFIANTLTLGANNIISDMLYERMSSPDSENGVWLGFYGNGQNLGDFSLSGGGAVIGMDFYPSKTSIVGGYVRYGANNAKQESDNATMNDIEFGLYGKTGLSKQFNLKGNISGGMQIYSAQNANENFDFNTTSTRGGFEVEFVAPAGKINIKPFIGLRSGFTSNDKIEVNDNQEIEANSFARVETLAGIGIDGKLSATINAYGKLYGKYMATGTNPKYKVNDTEVEGTIEPEIQAALSFGAEMTLSKPVSLFINAGFNFGSDLFGFGGGAGVNYRF